MTNVWAVSIEWRIYPHKIATLLRKKWILVGTRDAKLLHPEVKGGPLDSQTCGGPVGTGDNPPSLLESLANVVSLRFLHGNWSKGLRFGGIPQVRECCPATGTMSVQTSFPGKSGRFVYPSGGHRSS